MIVSTLSRWLGLFLIGLVHGYRLFFKQWVGGVCRFEPSCSAYALQALHKHGAARGGMLMAARILRCHPGCYGGHDPVPARFRFPGSGLFTRLHAADGDPAAAPPPQIRKIP